MPSWSPHPQDELAELEDLASAIDAQHAHECRESRREREEKKQSGSSTDAMLYSFKVPVSCPFPQKLNVTNMFVALDFHAGHF